MNEYVYLTKTLAAMLKTGYAPVRITWSAETPIATVARYYQQSALRVRWSSRRRALVVDLPR